MSSAFSTARESQSLVDAINPATSGNGLHVVIGVRGPRAPASYCNGLSLPMVTVSQIFTVDAASLARSVPRPDRMEEDAFRSALQDVLAPVMQTSDNVGANDEHRAINYLTAPVPRSLRQNCRSVCSRLALAAVDVKPFRLTGSRRIVSVVYACVSRTTGAADRFFARVDVTEQFPFLVHRAVPVLRSIVRGSSRHACFTRTCGVLNLPLQHPLSVACRRTIYGQKRRL